MIPDIHKTVIVTGASQGIGAGLVKAFLDRRYNVVATSRSITKTGGFKASDKLELVDGSIADLSTATRIVETAKRQFGAIDALVNNAGIYFSKAFTDYTVDDLRRLTSVNIEGFLFITQLVIKQMVAQKTNGCIVNITASLADHPIAGANSSFPMTTKGGLRPSQFTLIKNAKTLLLEFLAAVPDGKTIASRFPASGLNSLQNDFESSKN